MHLQEADLPARLHHLADHVADHAADRAHRNHDVRRIGSTVIIERMILASGDLRNLAQVLLHGIRKLSIERVVRLADLEIHVAVLHRIAQRRMLRIERAVAECPEGILIDQCADLLQIRQFDLVDLMRRSESIEEMHKRNAAFNRAQMRHRRKIRHLLHAAGGEHCKARLAACHDVAVVAEDAHRMRAHRTGRHMQHSRQPLARNTVKHRDHQHQTLRRRIRRCQRAGLKRAVHRRNRTGFRLHLRELHRLAEHVLPSLGRPCIRQGPPSERTA